jgi:hypothetical protein
MIYGLFNEAIGISDKPRRHGREWSNLGPPTSPKRKLLSWTWTGVDLGRSEKKKPLTPAENRTTTHGASRPGNVTVLSGLSRLFCLEQLIAMERGSTKGRSF